MTSISNGQFSVSWIKPTVNNVRQKMLLLELDQAVKKLHKIQQKYKFPIAYWQERDEVVACAEKLLKAFAVELAEAQAEEAAKTYCEQKENPFFK